MFSAEAAVRWLVNMRWHTIAVQVLTLAVARLGFRSALPYAPLAALVLVGLFGNAALALALRRPGAWHARATGLMLLADVAQLTALLALAGPSARPFATLYLALVAMGAFVLDRRCTVGLVLSAIAGHAWLVVGAGATASSRVDLLTFAATAIVIAAVVRRLTDAVRTRQDALVRAERASSRAEAVASLGALAAGAAHELATPLGTIAVVANDLDAVIADDPGRATEDAALIRAEVERCRAIISRMAARAGDQIGELPTRVSLAALHHDIVASLPSHERARVASTFGASEEEVRVPRLGLVQALASLASNGLAATGEGPVRITVTIRADEVVFEVCDEGPGIPPEILARLGDPFLTTKPAGKGMGLGIFLCHAFVDAWHGRLDFDTEGKGTRARLVLPGEAAWPPCLRAA